ncbi:diaminopimelate epimerase [Paenibacillus sp. CMAA1364]
MEFTKMHGLGNDFIIIYGEKELPNNANELAVHLCNRYMGIGADGLVFIVESKMADFQMIIINSDGSMAEQCGNAIRCVAKYVFDRGYISGNELTIETIGAGVQQVRLFIQDGRVHKVMVDMGEPILDGNSIPTTLSLDPIVDYPLTIMEREFRVNAVSMGNPHCIIYVEDAASFEIENWGPQIEVHPMFPRKVNVEFVTVLNRNHVDMRVWERGVGPTLACGTGACATLVSSVLNGMTDRSATISLAGGDLFIEWNEADNHVYMTGCAAEVYTGWICL